MACASMLRSPAEKSASLSPFIVLGLNRRFVYCPIPKTGSTFWRRMLKLVEFNRNVSSIDDYQTIKSEKVKLTGLSYFRGKNNEDSVQKFLKEATSFMFVREPYGRIFSAYCNKIYSNNYMYWRLIGRKVVEAVRFNASSHSLMFGHDVTFAEMIKYLVLKHKAGEKVDRHFSPMQQRCDPCKMNYDYIGKMETFADDAHCILNVLNAEDDNNNKRSPLVELSSESVVAVVESSTMLLFHNIEKTKGINYSSFKLFLRTWREFQIRGLLSKTINMPLTETQVSKINRLEFINLMTTTLQQPMNQTEVKSQRNEALVQAYRTVPRADLEELRKFVEQDCLLFGYDSRPSWLFDNLHTLDVDTSFNYFDAI